MHLFCRLFLFFEKTGCIRASERLVRYKDLFDLNIKADEESRTPV